ncbi:MAG TPA: hypothetical protein VJB87_04695 [Candidatus Nanoarchaeia archaeon]|nr:hypothetical protein [Candidatus Nanoarchaeia archaeon]
MKNCPICKKGPFEQVDDIIFDVEGYIFILEGARCQNCKEEFPDSGETQKTIIIARKLGVWSEPLKLYRHLSKSTGGLVFRIPADLERQLQLTEKTEIAISKQGKKIIIEPQ